MASRILKSFTNIVLWRLNTYRCRHLTNNSPTVSNRSSNVAKLHLSSAADNAIFKNKAQNIKCSFGCVACSAVLLKPNVANLPLFNFCEQKFIQHCPVTITVDCNSHSSFIFEEKWPNYASKLKSVTRIWCVGFSKYAYGFSVSQMRQFSCLHIR